MENGLAQFEEKAERNLLIMCKETEKLQKKAHELKRKLLLCQRKRELADVLDAQVGGHCGSRSCVLRMDGVGLWEESEGVLTVGVTAIWL